MCIAIGVKRGIALPSDEILHACWESNPDGAGFAFAHNGVVYIKKGFMTFDTFMSALKGCDKRYNLTECGVLLHFRIATHGGVIPAMTHPFPIVSDNGALSKLEYRSDYAVVHNGIISLTSATASRESGISDTAVFIRDYLTKIAQNKSWFKRQCNIELIYKLIGSKMAILNNRGEIIHTPEFIEDNGVLYSNTTYKTVRIRTTKNKYRNCNYGYSYGYDYDYDDCDYNYGYSYGYNGAYSGYNALNTATKSADKVALMRCVPGDSIEGDSVSDVCTSWSEREYAVSEEGFLYAVYDEKTQSGTYTDYALSFEFIGCGTFYDNANKEKEFKANLWPYEDQFLGGQTPKEIMDYTEAEIMDYTKVEVDVPEKPVTEEKTTESTTES